MSIRVIGLIYRTGRQVELARYLLQFGPTSGRPWNGTSMKDTQRRCLLCFIVIIICIVIKINYS